MHRFAHVVKFNRYNLLAIMGLKSKIADVDIPENLSWPQFVFQNFEQYGDKTAIVSTDELLSSSKRNKFALRCCFSESSRILTSFSYRCLTARKRKDAEISTSTCYKKSRLQQILIHLTFKLSELVNPTSIGSCILWYFQQTIDQFNCNWGLRPVYVLLRVIPRFAVKFS